MLRTSILHISALILCAACTTPPQRVDPPAPPPPAPPAPVEAPPPAPPPTRTATPQERQRAEQLANESVNHLQVGDVATARGLIEQALALDPNSDLARKMMRQLTADPVAELGATHFTYSIQREDTLARLAQRFMNDRYLFYILARYNDIAQPNVVKVGQVIKIPGKAPARINEPVPAEARPAGSTAPPPPAPPIKAPPVDDAAARQASESRERRKQIERYNAEGTAAFARQDLDKAIAAWDNVLQLDPDNQNAKLKRQQALDLKERLKRFDTKK